MLFNSIEFLIFFPLTTLLYFLVPHRYRWALLLIASCIFYMALIPAYILILFFTILVDYVAGILIEGAQGNRRKLYLALSIISNVSVLAFFKYFNFLNNTIASVLHFVQINYSIPALAIILPVGLSFHTFQAMSYTIEVYRGNQKAERHLGIYALYVMFYPQLVAGPIERPQNLIHQFREEHFFDYQRVTDGLKLMGWGMFKKVVIADTLAHFVGLVYNHPSQYQGLPLILATVLFAFQIYCDFSGYSDIAIGSAQVMGFKLMTNFNSPYFAKSVGEFWKRWHISLSTWFRDYLYKSLGGNRVVVWLWYFNLLFTFLVSGLWHGANWTFVVWGALNGFFLLVSIWTEKIRSRFVVASGIDKSPAVHGLIKTLITFSLICFAWIFFRANSLHDAYYISTHLLSGVGNFSKWFAGDWLKDFIIAVMAIVLLILIDKLREKISIRQTLAQQPFAIRWAVYYLLVTTTLVFGKFGSDAQQFIYFQF